MVLALSACDSSQSTPAAPRSAAPPTRSASPVLTGATTPALLVGQAVASNEGVYILRAQPSGAGPVEVWRVDVQTLQVTARSPSFPGAVDVAVVGQSVWVAGGYYSEETYPGNRLVYLLDAHTLTTLRTIALPESPEAILPMGTIVWVGGNHHLYRLDAATGALLVTLATDGTPGSLSLDPMRQRLYVAQANTSKGPLLVTERDPVTGAVEAGSAMRLAISGGEVSATLDGVWVTFASGMANTVVKLRASDLMHVTGFTPPGRYGAGRWSGYALHGVLVVSDRLHTFCASLDTGLVRTQLPMKPGHWLVGAPAGQLFDVGSDGTVSLYTIGMGCLS